MTKVVEIALFVKNHLHILFVLLLLVGMKPANAQDETNNFVYTEYGKLYTSGMVDLGLSVKWAACNLGANSPDEYGDYYAWGETKTKDSYTEENSLTYGKSISELHRAGITDANGVLTAKYDVVTKKIGSGYRMPTYEEEEELLYNCAWVWSQYKGVNGYYVEGKNGSNRQKLGYF